MSNMDYCFVFQILYFKAKEKGIKEADRFHQYNTFRILELNSIRIGRLVRKSRDYNFFPSSLFAKIPNLSFRTVDVEVLVVAPARDESTFSVAVCSLASLMPLLL
jgi:hypothetical protein